MTLPTALYFVSILLTCLLTGFLAWYAWQRRSLPGVRAYAWLALAECLLALCETFSMLSPNRETALSWFQARFLFTATMPVLFLVFALGYSGRQEWLSKRLLVGLFTIPVITQVMLWSNSLHGLWLVHEVTFHRNGPLWIVETGARVPGVWFLAHSFYSLLLMLAGIVVLLVAAWGKRKAYLGRALLLSAGALTGVIVSIIPIFNLNPQAWFNPFTPGIGLSAVLYALAIFRFQFLKGAPMREASRPLTGLDAQEKRSLALFGLVFLAMTAGIAAAGYFSYRNFERQHRAQAEKGLLAIVELKVDGLVNWRAERIGDADILFYNTAFSNLAQRVLENPADAQAQAELQNWLDSLLYAYQYSNFYLLDANGQERLVSLPETVAVPQHLAGDVLPALQAGRVTFLDFHRHADGEIRLGLLIPIYANQDLNRPLGVLALEMDPSTYLYPYLQEWPAPSETAETLLVQVEGDEVLFLNPLRFQSDSALNLRTPLTNTDILAVKAVLGETGVAEGLDYRNQPVIGALHPVPGTPWFLVARMDAAEVYAPLRERLWQTLLFFGMLILASGAGLGLTWRQQRVRYYRAQARIADSLRASEERFRLAFETSPDSVAITRLSDGTFVSVNQGFEQVTGYMREEVIGKTSLEIHLWKDPEDRRKIVEGLQARGEVRDYEAPFLTRDGEIIGLMSAVIIRLDGEPHILNITRNITERKQAEKALRESEKLLREMAANYPNSYISIIEKDLTIGFTSGQEFKKLGLDPKSFVGLTLEQVFGEQAPFVRENYLKAFGGAETEFELFINDQHQLYRAVPLTGDDGKIDSILAVVENITERKRAEQALQEAEARYRALVEQIPAIIYRDSVEQTGQTLYISPQIETVLGYVPEEWMADKDFWIEIMHPDDRERVSAAYEHANETGQSFEAEYRLVRPDGREAWIRDEAALIYGPSGSPLFWQGILLDITARKRAEQALRESEERQRTILESMLDNVVLLDAEGRIQYINHVSPGLDEKEVLGSDWLMWLEEADREIAEQAIQRTVDSGEVTEIEYRAVGPGRGMTWFRVRFVRMPGTSAQKVLLIATDISERRQAEEQLARYTERLEEIVDERTRELREAQEKLVRQERLAVLGQLAGSIGHELRNPLGVIANAVYFLKMSQPEADDRVKEYLDIIENETRGSDKIVTDLLDFTRVKSLDQAPVSVSQAAQATLDRHPAPPPVEVTLDIPPDLPPAYADPRHVEQILGNLVTNACQAMTNGGELTIAAIADGDMILISVRDTGVGIPQENMDKVFEPLFTTKSRGIGLGLAVSRKLAEANGGQLEAQSEAGAGSVFTLYLPVYKETK
ncbi:MAG: PAS domain S-box protein [Chloroflexota bacterium]